MVFHCLCLNGNCGKSVLLAATYRLRPTRTTFDHWLIYVESFPTRPIKFKVLHFYYILLIWWSYRVLLQFYVTLYSVHVLPWFRLPDSQCDWLIIYDDVPKIISYWDIIVSHWFIIRLHFERFWDIISWDMFKAGSFDFSLNWITDSSSSMIFSISLLRTEYGWFFYIYYW